MLLKEGYELLGVDRHSLDLYTYRLIYDPELSSDIYELENNLENY